MTDKLPLCYGLTEREHLVFKSHLRGEPYFLTQMLVDGGRMNWIHLSPQQVTSKCSKNVSKELPETPKILPCEIKKGL